MKAATLIEDQSLGWFIEEAEGDTRTLACPRRGCGVRLHLREGQPAPPCDSAEGHEILLGSHDDARKALRVRREQLGLSIADVEHLAGLASSHLLKAEKDNPSRRVELDTLVPWAESLGFQVALVPVALPRVTVNLIAETRHLVEPRRRTARQAAEARERKRETMALPAPAPPPGLPLWRNARKDAG